MTKKNKKKTRHTYNTIKTSKKKNRIQGQDKDIKGEALSETKLLKLKLKTIE
jgi:hypothetical protein